MGAMLNGPVFPDDGGQLCGAGDVVGEAGDEPNDLTPCLAGHELRIADHLADLASSWEADLGILLLDGGDDQGAMLIAAMPVPMVAGRMGCRSLSFDTCDHRSRQVGLVALDDEDVVGLFFRTA